MNNFQQNNPQNKQNYQQKQQQYNTSNQGKLSNLNFWEDETKEKVNLKIFDEAEKLVDNYKGMTTSQLRNFYNEVKNIEKIKERSVKNIEKIKERSDIDDSQIFNLIMIRLKLLKAKLNYNQNRSINKRNQGFKNFSSDFSNILDSKIKTLKDFDVFCKFFEALVGYFYGSNQ
jgi:CRISPR type III-A-associated protein Csm2